MVDLAPGWYLGERGWWFGWGQGFGYRFQGIIGNEPGLIAREVTVNGTTLRLRDEKGIPVWQRKGPGGGMGQGMKSGGRGQGQGPPPGKADLGGGGLGTATMPNRTAAASRACNAHRSG